MQQVAMGGAVKNDLWITDKEDVPDPSPLPELPGYHVLVRPISVKSQTKGGIFIPDSTKEDMSYLTTVGQVIALGDLAYAEKEKFPNGPWCKQGDWVVFGRYAGSRLKIEGGEVRLLNDDEILGTVESPEDVLTII